MGNQQINYSKFIILYQKDIHISTFSPAYMAPLFKQMDILP